MTTDESKTVTVYQGIRALYTLTPAARKSGRRIQKEDLGLVTDAAFVVRHGRIAWVGERSRLPVEALQNADEVREIDLRADAVLPAFIEPHTHLVFAGNRAEEFERRNQGESYQSIAASGGGILSTVLATRQASETELIRLGNERAQCFVRQGVATIEVKSGYGLNLESEVKMLRAAQALEGPRIITTFLGAHAVSPDFPSAESYIEALIRDFLPRVKSEKLAARVDIFVENGYFSAELGRRYFAAAALDFDLVVHADQLSRSGGAELAVEFGARSADHLICIDSDDISRLAASDVTCVLLPSADLYMKCPYPPARVLIDAGARVALSTDFNPGSSPSQDLALVGVLARVEMKMSLAETIAAYTIGGAHALGLGDELGSFCIGKRADFSVIDGGIDELFLSIGRLPVRALYRDGVALFQS